MKIGIVGLGLIGGSLGLKLQRLNHTIYGIANNEFNEKKAKDKKLANFVSCDLSLLKKCELIILALPIKDLISPSQQLVSSIPQETILTDVGSVKEPIVNKWENLHPLFIGSHPMAGTEKKGVDSGFEGLFKNAKWIITPTQKSLFCGGVIIHFAFLKRPSKPESTPCFSVPAIGCDPINKGCKCSHVLTIGSLTEPTSVTIVSFGIDSTNC